jgi:hypothetical protein
MKPGPRPGFRWSRTTVLYALDLWHRRHLQTPTAKEWNRAGDDHPSLATVRRLFGSWNAAVRAAGLRPRRPGERGPSRTAASERWPQAVVVDAIVRFEADHGRPPLLEEWRRAADGFPCVTTVQRRFGSWNAAIEAAGFDPRDPGTTLRPRSATHVRCPATGRWLSARVSAA